ncbi:type IV secretion system protein VirB10 [Thiolapillus sp.]|uniref:type IV secretion system protein VirB10 n=1 Tax=Thiolapillus sp. TaxID=2017437 RepID=UPI0025F13884|nr:type IV secretion system protein VirB10 [Thiolapillus sp.]
MSDKNPTEEAEIQDEEAERGFPSLNRERPKGANTLGILVVSAIAGVALIWVNGGFGDKTPEVVQQQGRVSSILPPLSNPPPPPPREQPAPAPVVAQEPPKKNEPVPIYIPRPQPILRAQKPTKKPITPEERKRKSDLFATKVGSNSGASPFATMNHGNGNRGGGTSTLVGMRDTIEADSLDARLSPSRLKGSKASIIIDRSFMLTQGTFLDCVLETALSSDVPGMTACRLSRDVYSADGKLLLLERGSKLVGEYQSSLQRGQARLFVIWTRVETPNGVIVSLDSPGTDALGRSGLSGYINRHFWERFGAAMLLSLVDDFSAYALANTGNTNGDSIEFSNTTKASEDIATIVLKDSVGIKPTLVKNQGDHINIFVARDLDFRGVYDIELTN